MFSDPAEIPLSQEWFRLSEAWIVSLDSTGESLERFAGEIARSFSESGIKLHNFRSVTNQLSQHSLNVTGQLTGVQIAASAKMLGLALEQLQFFHAHLQRGSSALFAILEEFHQCHRKLGNISNIIRTINSVSVRKYQKGYSL